MIEFAGAIFPMRRFGWILLLLAGLLSVVLPQLAAQDEVATVAVLQVVDTEPLEGQELGLNEPITLYFDRALNCSTVDAAFSITPQIAGELTCEASRFTFTPATSYERATVYTVTLSTDILAEAGMQLLEPYTVEFTTTGFLLVGEVFPANNTEAPVPLTTTLTVIFNRPVVPLVTSLNTADLPQPLRIEPEVAGTGEWLNTSIYVFKPTNGLMGGTEYTVTIPAGLTATDGSVLTEDYEWRFSTAYPQVQFVMPNPGDGNVDLNESMQIAFNQPMDRASVESAFYLRAGDQTASVAGTFGWGDNDYGFTFHPSEQLQINTLYEMGFNEGAHASSSDAGLVGERAWTFATVPYPAILRTDPSDGMVGSPLYGGVTLYFASPMNEATLKDKVTVEPAPRSIEYYYHECCNEYAVSFSPEPGVTYNVTVAPGMEDVYGNAIEQPYSFSYTTENFGPDVQLNVPGTIGFYNAYREPTQLFLWHRNVSEINLQLYRVPTEAFVDAMADTTAYDPPYNFKPAENTLLRDWTIPSVAPTNAMRYELLVPARASLGSVCPEALPTRLTVGDLAVVVSDPDPVRARIEPTTDGEILDLLYKDYSLPIVEGPVCTGRSLLWWRVQLRDDRLAWVAESVDGEYMLDVRTPAQATGVTVPTGEGEDTLAPGVYFLRASAPEERELGYANDGHFMVVSTAVLTVKVTLDDVTIWATNAQTGAPMVDAPIRVFNKNGREVARGTTNADGILTTSIPRLPDLYTQVVAVLAADGQFGMGFSDWTGGIEPWNFGTSYDFYPNRYQVYVYTDRPLYRPGQPVYFRGLVRLKDDVSYTRPDIQSVPVEITDERGEIVYQTDLPVTQFGTVSGSFELADDASLGYYYVNIKLPSSYEYETEGGGVGFSVAEYRLPEYQVEVQPITPAILQGDTASVGVNATYYFGGAVTNADVSYNVLSQGYTFQYTGEDGYYDFYDYNYDDGPYSYYDSGYDGIIADGTVQTDSQGNAVIEIAGELKDKSSSREFTIEATVSDESNQTVSGRTTLIVHKGLVYVGARAESYVSVAGEDSNIEIITVDWDSQSVPGQAVDVEIVERRWSNIQEMDESTGRTIWSYEVEEIPVTEGSVTTDDSGKALFTFTPPNGGIYKAIVTTRDSKGNEVRASTMMWVSSGDYVTWRQSNDNRIQLVADKQDYEIGDTAEILITSPFQGTTEALITVERGSVLKIERVTLDSNSYVYKLPITGDYAPNIYVSVFLVKGVDDNNPIAAFKMGYVELRVATNQKLLNIEISANTERAQPQETVTYTVKTTDYKGDPVAAELGIGVTDLAALSLAAPNSGPLLPYFYGVQSLGVRTGSTLTINTDQLTQETLDTIKGGGGGGGGGGGIIAIRGEFIDTPYWNGALVTNENGEATFDVRLPDNLTTWRLDARGLTLAEDGNLLLGETTFDLLSTKPLLIRPVTPRFFVVGDTVLLSAVINNNTASNQQAEVTLESSGLTLKGDATQTVTIPAGDRARITWEVTVGDVRAVQAVFIVDAGEFNDASISPVALDDDGTLPVYRYEVPETVGTSGTLRSADSRLESILLPQRYDVTEGELTIKVEQSLAGATLEGLDYLRNYPYQCIEQTVSRFLPNTLTYQALVEFNLQDEDLNNGLKQALSYSLQRLYAEQKSDGGWGWFIQDASDELTTAYALLGLTVAKDAGYTISDNVIQSAQSFLQTRFIVPDIHQPRWRMDRQAFVLYALARSGAPDISRTVMLYDNRQNLSLYAKAFLAQTLALIAPEDTARQDQLVSELVNAAAISASGVHWTEDQRDYYNWNTNLRTTAIALNALIELRPESDLIPNAVRYLMSARTADAWETTQETAWSVMALSNWMRVSGELNPNYEFSVSLNDRVVMSGAATADTVMDAPELTYQVSDLLKDEANSLLFERTSGDGVLYYTAHLEAYLPVTAVEPLNRGILVERRYYRPGSEDPVTEAVVGEVLDVRLTVIAPNDLHYVVINDPLPAGVEAINPDLQTSAQIGTRPELNSADPLSYGWGWWWFSNIEFRDESVVLYSTYLPAGTYEYRYSVRAGIEGTYNVIPATGQEFYFPEVYGRNAGSIFTVRPE
jgi:alpha-2-macroglobulin